jgi:tRNA(Ile)-lysidine synthase TilS/MesJ
MKKIISQINTILLQRIKLKPTEILICAISGGQDSIFLFLILLHLKKQWNINIQLLHFHHFWQEKNFFSMADIWKLSFIFSTPIYIIPSEKFLYNEKKARNWRQKGLERVSNIVNSTNILLGHTASDRIETAFWHFIRGTSPQGLISLKWQSKLIRQIYFFDFPKFLSNYSKIFSFSQLSFKKQCFFKQKKNKIYKIKNNYNVKKFKNKKQKIIFIKNKSFILLKKNINNYKKKSTKIQTVSFLFFKSYLFNTYFFMKKSQTNYSFLVVVLCFSKKNLLRPLLFFHRNDITFLTKKYLIPIMYDPTNEKLCWSRNRIRNQLFPFLRVFFNTNTEYLINNFLEITIEEQQYIEYIVEKILQSWYFCFYQRKKDSKEKNFYLIKKQFQLLPKAIQRYLLLKIIKCYTKLQPNLVQIELLRITIQKN